MPSCRLCLDRLWNGPFAHGCGTCWSTKCTTRRSWLSTCGSLGLCHRSLRLFFLAVNGLTSKCERVLAAFEERGLEGITMIHVDCSDTRSNSQMEPTRRL